MAFKEFQLPDIGAVTVYKRKGANNLRLSVKADGSIRVTIPTWTPYAAGVSFASSRRAWIQSHRRPPVPVLVSGQLIGKSHRLQFVAKPKITAVSTRLRQTEIVISYPIAVPHDDAKLQQAAAKASIRALRTQASRLLPIRLQELAAKHGFSYKTVSIKLLKTRWGSCDQDKNIVLNLYLMKLPWQLIDYVILHELTHTQVLQHGPKFWAAMARVEPNVQQLRKAMHEHQPTL